MECIGGKLDNMQADAEATGDKDASLQMVYSRNGLRDTVTVRTDSLFRVGATFSSLADYKETTREFGFFESFPAGVQLGVNTLKGYVNDMKYVFTKEGAKSVGGFGTIGSIFRKYGIGIVLGNDCFSVNHSCVYEYSAYSGIGWRTCIIPAL